MKPARTTRHGSYAATCSASAASHSRAAGVVRDGADERGDAGALRAGQALDAVAVGADGRDPHAVRRVGRGVEQRLQVGAGTGDQDDDVARACGAAPSRNWPVARRIAHGERG